MKSNKRRSKELEDYMLNDYQFLEDYEVVDSHRSSRCSLVAHIRDSDQKVRFVKRKYNDLQFARFKALHRLYKSGIVLADNMFLLEECEELYFYVIEAEIEQSGGRFESLLQYLYHRDVSEEERKGILAKIKILVDCLHQEGEAFAGLDPRRIIIDEDKHIYLAPFDLDYELKTDNFSRSYYPPELLHKMKNNDAQVNEQMMLKWDIWAFGCIALELLAYASPVFMSTSINKQLESIEQCAWKEQVEEMADAIQNVVINSLCVQVDRRTISTQKIEEMQRRMEVNTVTVVEQLTSTIKKGERCQKGGLRELNLHKDMESGDSELTLNLFNLSNIQFDRELHVTVHLFRKFHFYLDYDQNSPDRYFIQRKITIRANFADFTRLLMAPIVVQLKEDDKIARIGINLQTLVVLHEGRRIWSQQLMGSYGPEDGPFLKGKLKISCQLDSPEVVSIPNTIQQQDLNVTKVTKVQQKEKEIDTKQNKLTPTKPKPTEPTPLSSLSQNLPTDPSPKKRKKASPTPQKLPSISQIAQNIVFFTNEFKRKLSIPQQTQIDPLQRKLQSLLELQ